MTRRVLLDEDIVGKSSTAEIAFLKHAGIKIISSGESQSRFSSTRSEENASHLIETGLPVRNDALGNHKNHHFDYHSPLNIILLNPEKYEEILPSKGIGNNIVYTIKDCSNDDITDSDDNGAYINPASTR